MIKITAVNYKFTYGLDEASWHDKLAQMIADASAKDSQVVVFPELISFDLLSSPKSANKASEIAAQAAGLAHGLQEFMAHKFKGLDLLICLGTIACLDEGSGKIVNRSLNFHGGELLFSADKLFLTPDEHKLGFTPGQKRLPEIGVFGDFRFSTLICLDIEIPKLSYELSKNELDLILVPSMTHGELGTSRVNSCARARAIEHTCLVSVASCYDDELYYNGRCGLYGPVLEQFSESPLTSRSEEFLVGKYDLTGLKKLRDEKGTELVAPAQIQRNFD